MPKVLMGPGPLATTTAAGLMSAADKIKLNGITTGAAVTDVQVNGTSVLSNGVANVPMANTNDPGVVKMGSSYSTGLKINSSNVLLIDCAGATQIKQHTNYTMPITPYYQDQSTFYGLAKAAGDSTQALSDNAVGTYTAEAKAAIQTMLGVNNSQFVVNFTDLISSYRANKTVAEISNALQSGMSVVGKQDEEYFQLLYIHYPGSTGDPAYAVFALNDKHSTSTFTLYGDGTVTHEVVNAFYEGIVAPSYDDLSFPVSEGAYCIYNDGLLKANQDIDEYEEYDSEHWDATDISYELYLLNQGLSVSNSEIESVEDSIAPQYEDLTFPVSKGKHCYHDGDLYMANTNIQTSEAWNSAHWTKRIVTTALESVESNITAIGSVVAAKYQKPSGGIPSSDMASAVQTSLGKADTAYQKPSGGIPASDIASGVIPDVSGKIDKPSNPASGSFLVYNGTNWVAQTLSTWQGGNY